MYAGLYIGAIFVFALGYWYLPFDGCNGLDYADAIYFSAVTITTLGYGDISPNNDMAKYLAASEAVFGVVVLGAFLLHFAEFQSRKFKEERVSAQKENLLRSYRFFREQVLALFIKALFSHGYLKNTKISERQNLQTKLYKFDNYIEYFDDNNEAAFEALRDSVKADAGLVDDLYLEVDLFNDQLNLAILAIPFSNGESIEWLNSFQRDIARIRRSENMKKDPSGNFLTHLDDIMRNTRANNVDPSEDVFERNVQNL